MRKEIIIGICMLVFISGCNSQTKSIEFNEDVPYTNDTCSPKLSIQTKYVNCPEGCIYEYTITNRVPEEILKAINYSLNYTLYEKQDNCGLHSLIYYIPNGTFTHIYNRDMELLAGFRSEECINITYGDVTFKCQNHTEEVTYSIMSEPRKYITIGDCK